MAARHAGTISRELDSGDVTLYAVHVGDGQYRATYKCRVCGDEAEKELTAVRQTILGHWDAWAREHWHNP